MTAKWKWIKNQTVRQVPSHLPPFLEFFMTYLNPFDVRDMLKANGFWYTLWFYTPLEAWGLFVGWQMLRFERKQWQLAFDEEVEAHYAGK